MTNPVDKFLLDAISAARDHADEAVDDGARTRLRLRESLANQGSRRKRFALIAAVIGSLFGSTAFAAYWAGWRPPWSDPEVVETHENEAHEGVSMRLPETRRGSAHVATADGVETIMTIEPPPEITAIRDAGLVAEVGSPPAPPAPPVGIRVAKPGPVDTKVETRVRVAKPVSTGTDETRVRVAKPVSTTKVETPPIGAEQKPAPRETSPSSPRVTTSSLPDEAPKGQRSAELAAYRRAHDLHFRGRDPKAALRAWDDYLAAYPDGSLALEARYDRALVLVKLARWSEARAALAPFANAKAGAYRQKEATEILAAIHNR